MTGGDRGKVLLPKLIPFAQKYGLLVQQDLAPSHKAKVNQELIQESGLEQLEWPGNSPDLNMIEPSWTWMKRGAGLKPGFEIKEETRSYIHVVMEGASSRVN